MNDSTPNIWSKEPLGNLEEERLLGLACMRGESGVFRSDEVFTVDLRGDELVGRPELFDLCCRRRRRSRRRRYRVPPLPAAPAQTVRHDDRGMTGKYNLSGIAVTSAA